MLETHIAYAGARPILITQVVCGARFSGVKGELQDTLVYNE